MDGSTPGRRRLAFSLAAVAAFAGCAHPSARPAARTVARVAQAPIVVADPPESAPQQRAQRTWCAYLEVLYQRSTKDGTPWGRLDECLTHGSTASPAMLLRTAECSRKALDGFNGDPLTAEYAGEVRRCGSEAIDAAALSAAELEPLAVTLCQRTATCDGGSYAECRTALDGPPTARLGRAVGAINVESRDKLRACLRVAACDEPMSERISGCLEPIMDRLLWLPSGHDR